MTTEKKDTLALQFGALAPRIEKQLSQQGFTLYARDLHGLQEDADAITRLLVRGYMAPNTASATRKKLLGKILALLP